MVVLFNIAGFAIVGWALMILLPGWNFTKRLVNWTAFPVAVSALYVIGLIAVLIENGLGVIADFGTAGFLTYWIVRVVRRRGSGPEGAENPLWRAP